MPVVGLAQVLVEPVFTGSQRKIGREMGPIARKSGQDAGRQMGDGIASGLAAKTPDIEAAVKKTEKAVLEATEKVASARNKAKTAADAQAKAEGNLAVAEQRLAEAKTKGTAAESQLLSLTNRVAAARSTVEQATTRVESAQRRLTDVTGDLTSAQEENSKSQQDLQRHMRAVAAETDRNSTAWGRLENSVRNAVRGRSFSEWTRDAVKSNRDVATAMDDLAVSVEHSGTRGGRAFTRAFGIIGVTLAGVTPLAGAAGAAFIGAAGAASTLAGDLSRLGGVAALLPSGLMAAGAAAGTLRAAFWGVGEAMTEALEVDKRAATMGQNPRLAAMAIEDAVRGIAIAEENAARSRVDSARRVADAQRNLQDTVESVAEAQESAAERVADAEENLARTVESAAEAQERALDSVLAAERRLRDAREAAVESQQRAAERIENALKREADAIKDVRKAQDELTKAREKANDQVKAIAGELDRANRKTVETAAAYSRAVAMLSAAKARPTTSAAEIAFLEGDVSKAAAADRDAKMAVADLQKEHRKVTEEVKRGTEEMRAAEEKLTEARENQADASKDVAKARQDAVKSERDSAERIADAQKGISDAQEQVGRTARDNARDIADAQEAIVDAREEAAKASEDGARRIADAEQSVADAAADSRRAQVDSARAVEDAHRQLERVQLQQADAATTVGENAVYAMDQLTPAAQKAVRALLQVYDRLGAVRRIAQENFFTGFVPPLMALADTVIPQLEVGVGAIATALGEGAQQLMRSLESGFDDGVLQGLLLVVADSIRILNDAIDPIVQAFITLGVVGMEYLPDFATWIRDIATQFNTFIQDAAASGQLNAWIEAGIQGFKDIGSIISSTVGIFSALNDAARAGGIDVTLGGIAAGLNDIEAAMQGETFQTTMSTIFGGAAAGSKGLADGLAAIGDAFVKGAPAFAEFLRLGGEITGLIAGDLANALADPTFGAGLTSFLEGVKQGVTDMGPLLPGLFASLGDILTQLGPLARELGPTLVEVFTGFAEVVGFLLTVLEPLLEWFVSSPVAMGLVIGAFVATAGASAALTAAANLQKVAVAALRVVTFGLSIAQGLVTAALGRSTGAIAANRVAMVTHAVATGIMTTATKVWAAVTKGAAIAMRILNGAMKANPIGLLMTLLAGLVAAMIWFFTETEIGRKIVKVAWEWIQGAIRRVVEWFQKTVVPAWETAMGALGQLFKFLYEKYVKPYFDFVKTVIKAVYDWFTKTLVPNFKVTMGVLGAVFKLLYNDYVKPVIKWVREAFQNLVDWFTDDLPRFFSDAVKGIGDAWGKLQELAKKPVRFVVDKVINDGLISTFNKIPGVDIDPIKLPEGFARGGVLPGYNSRKFDDVLTPMRSGEGVLVPEAVRGVGAGFIHALNKAGNTGGVAAVKSLAGQMGILHPGRARGGLIHPLPGYPMTSGYGVRYGLNTPGNFHDGYDFGAPTGTLVRAPGAGIVERAGWAGMAGNMIQLQHANGLETVYYHLNSVLTRLGATVKQGQGIGRVGSTGNSTGPHLHYIVRRNGQHVNPGPYLSGGGDAGTPGNQGSASYTPPENPFNGLINIAMDKLKERFPQGGMVIEAVGGLVKSGFGQVTKWVNDIKNGIKNLAGSVVNGIKGFFGMNHGGAPEQPAEDYLFRDNGGILPPGVSQVLNATGQNEYVLNPQQWRDIHHLARTVETRGNGGDIWNVQLPERSTVDDLMTAVGFEQRRVARGGARRR